VLADNIIFLKKNCPVLYEILKKGEDETEKSLITLEDTKNNKKTLRIEKDEKSLYLHSKYDPIREAETIIDKLEEREEIDDESQVIFYGLGLGYHIDSFIKRFPDTAFSIYEPSIEVFKQFLEYRNLKDISTKKMLILQCEVKPEVMDEFFNIVLNNADQKTIIMDLPIYQSAFKEQHNRFSNRFLELIKGKRSSLNVNYAFQKRWIINSIINFKEVLNTPNILMQDENIFKDKAAILVAAGPSLDYEIENLRIIKEKGLAYIFALGSAVNALIHHNIFPDAICTYDPSEDNNKLVFKKINEMQINSIPLIFGSSVGFEVLQDYQGPKYHMVTTQDTIANYFLKTENEKGILKVADAPTIAVVTLELLNKLKFSTIVLVGQNLAYKDKKNYADGIDYSQSDAYELQEKTLKIKDVLKNEIETNDSFNRMRSQMEFYIKSSDVPIINTTIGGAHIEGTEFMQLERVMNDKLQFKRVQGNEFGVMMKSDLYDKKYLCSKLKLMEDENSKYKTLLSEIRQQILKIKELVKNSNIKQISIMYNKLDYFINKLEANEFFKVITMPMNRVQYELLVNNIKRIKIEKNELKKTKQALKNVEPFIDLLYSDNNLNEKIMEGLRESIEHYI